MWVCGSLFLTYYVVLQLQDIILLFTSKKIICCELLVYVIKNKNMIVIKNLKCNFFTFFNVCCKTFLIYSINA